MSRTKKERSGENEKLLAMRMEVETELLLIPGVRRVGVGLKVTNCIATEDLCFRVYVDQKKPVIEIPAEQVIPKVIRNFKTDVNQVPQYVRASGKSDDNKYRPLWGGTKILSSKAKEAGTLGCLAIDNDSGNIVLLSCYHILMGNGEQQGHQVAQPDFCCDSCCCRCGEIAKVERGAWAEKNVDAAIAILSDDFVEKWTNDVIDIGPVTPVPLNAEGNPKIPVKAGDTVFKRGIDTRVTEGLILEAEADIDVIYNTPTGTEVKSFTKQLLIKPKVFNIPFSEKGDSGAVIVDEFNQVIGLLYSDNTGGDSFDVDGPQSYANPIQDVIKALDITIPETGTLEAMPLRSNVDKSGISKRDILDELEKTIEQHEDGNLLIAVFKEHRQEVMHLINTDREVKVTWNRFHGPLFAAHLMEKLNNRAYKVPTEIDGISYQRLLTKMSVLLEKKGSAQMASDIEKYSAKALLLLANLIQSFNEGMNI